jgi:hypothetical protein
MSLVDFKEIPLANTGGGEQDTFELFARDFFWNLGFQVEENPSRGADGGKDIILIEPLVGIFSHNELRWLVSCKHFAHSGNSVSRKHEIDIHGRVKVYKCDGFIAFYSTLPSSGLANILNAIKNEVSVQVYDKARIEHFLVTEQRLRIVLQRYFPNSYKAITQNYTWEKLYTTVLILASGNGSVQDRLIDAYISSLMRLEPDDLPKVLRKEFSELQYKLTRVEPSYPGEGRIHATISKMENIEANKVVEQIISIYDRYRVNLIDDLWH